MMSPRERDPWDRLYARGKQDEQRTPAEVQSVPVPSDWGTLPVEEWQANKFCTRYLSNVRRVLDLGCGTGSIAAAWLQRCPGLSIVGIDVSAVAIGIGQENLARRP